MFVLAQALVLVARDPLTFLVGWEAMTLVPAAVILVYRAARPPRTVFVYVAVTHLAGAGTWIAILLLAREGAIGDPTVSRPARVCRSRSRSLRLSGWVRRPV